MKSLQRIALSLERQCEQHERVLGLWEKNNGLAEKGYAISQRHLEIAEERRKQEMYPLQQLLAELSKMVEGMTTQQKEDVPVLTGLTAIELLADVMHLWVDGYISKNPNSAAPLSVSIDLFDKVSRFLEANEIAVDYSGWHKHPVDGK